MPSDIDDFLNGQSFAVVGASNDRQKFGNKVLRCYLEHGLAAYPVNPNRKTIEGWECFPTLADIPCSISGISLITKPSVSEKIVEEAAALGIKRLWFQPGAESDAALQAARGHDMMVISGGPCLLVSCP